LEPTCQVEFSSFSAQSGHRAAAKPASRCFSCLEAQDLAQKGEKLPLGYHSAVFFWVDFWGGELFSLLKLGMLPHRFVYKQHEMSAACLQDVHLQQLQSPGDMVIIVLQ